MQVTEGDLHVHYEDGAHHQRRTLSTVVEVECPYPGLAAYGPEQAHWFFGRDRLIADILERLSDLLIGGGPLMLVAPSGAGKLSLIRAGVLPRIVEGALAEPGSTRWPRLVCTPTAQPISVLATHLAPLLDLSVGATADLVASAPGDVIRLLTAALASRFDAGARLVVIVDQLEELFTQCTDATQRGRFVDMLARLSDTATGAPPAVVLCGLRSDFYTPCADHPALRDALQREQVFVGPMSTEQLREAILFPARAVGLAVEPGLTELLLSDLRGNSSTDKRAGGGYEAGRLPLLAHALRVTWQQRSGRTLTVAGYETTGGIEQAVATSAERVYHRLEPALQQVTRAVFLRLVTVGRGGDGLDDTRRRNTRADLDGVGDPTAVSSVLAQFTQSRLLTSQQDTIEITHEALLRAWPRLRAWIDTDRAGNQLRQQIEETATTWHSTSHDTALLLRGSRLDTARCWLKTHPGELNPTATAFLAASARQRRRAATLRRAAIVLLVVLMLTASTLAVFAHNDSRTADQQRDLAVSREVIAEATTLRSSDASLAAELDVAAYRIQPTADAQADLVDDAANPLSTSLSNNASPDYSIKRHLFATIDSNRRIRIWNSATPNHLVPLSAPFGEADANLTFDADANQLASVVYADTETVQLWNISDPAHPLPTGEPLMPFGGQGGHIDSVALSPDGRLLAASELGGFTLWALTDGGRQVQHVASFFPNNDISQRLAFSPDSRVLADAGGINDTVSLWNVADPDNPTQFGSSFGNDSTSAAFSPDGRILAVGGGNGTLQLWDVMHPADPIQEISKVVDGDNSGYVTAVAFSLDDHVLATASGSTVRLWNLTDGSGSTARDGLLPDREFFEPLGPPLTDGTDGGGPMSFSPDGHVLANGGIDSVRLWTVPPTWIFCGPGWAFDGAFSPYNGYLTARCEGQTGMFWSVHDPTRPVSLGFVGLPSSLRGIGFGTTGRTVAVIVARNLIQLWRMVNSGQFIPLDTPFPSASQDAVGSPEFLTSLAISPDGRLLAAVGNEGTFEVWNISDPKHPRLLGKPILGDGFATINSVVFRPGVQGPVTLIGAKVQLWTASETAGPRPLGPAFSVDGEAQDVASSPNGQTLATGSDDDVVRLWNVGVPTNPRQLGPPLTGHSGYVSSVAFDPTGTVMASASEDNTIQLWNVSDPTAAGHVLIGHGDAVNSVAFSPDGKVLASTGNDGTVRLWLLDPEQDIQLICAEAAGNLTQQQWQKYIPDVPYQAPCR